MQYSHQAVIGVILVSVVIIALYVRNHKRKKISGMGRAD
jgi:hypothetical protein